MNYSHGTKTAGTLSKWLHSRNVQDESVKDVAEFMKVWAGKWSPGCRRWYVGGATGQRLANDVRALVSMLKESGVPDGVEVTPGIKYIPADYIMGDYQIEFEFKIYFSDCLVKVERGGLGRGGVWHRVTVKKVGENGSRPFGYWPITKALKSFLQVCGWTL